MSAAGDAGPARGGHPRAGGEERCPLRQDGLQPHHAAGEIRPPRAGLVSTIMYYSKV